MNRLDARLDPARIAGPGAAVGDTLVWDGGHWVAGPSAAVYVGPSEPPQFGTGSLWYDTDATS